MYLYCVKIELDFENEGEVLHFVATDEKEVKEKLIQLSIENMSYSREEAEEDIENAVMEIEKIEIVDGYTVKVEKA